MKQRGREGERGKGRRGRRGILEALMVEDEIFKKTDQQR
jgi:hypothetical protein